MAIICLKTISGAEDKPLDYYNGLLEYHLINASNITDAMAEEYAVTTDLDTCLQNKNNEFKWKPYLSAKGEELTGKIKEKGKEEHKYQIFTRADLGEFDFNKHGFKCPFFKEDTVIKLDPTAEKDARGKGIISQAILEGVVNEIKILVLNPKKLNILAIPDDKANSILEKRTDKYGMIDRKVYLKLNTKIKKYADRNEMKLYKKKADGMLLPGYFGKYFLVINITGVEVYDDKEFNNKLGELTTEVKQNR